MSQMTITEAAKHFGISREAIHNRIRRGSLTAVMVGDQKMVDIDPALSVKKSTKVSASKSSLSDDRYYKLLEEQNKKLQEKVASLEGETRSLRDQKELMLIEERQKIENIYKEKDEQLKNILSTLSQQFLLATPKEEALEAEMIEETVEVKEKPKKLISLKKHLKSQVLSDKKKAKIFSRFTKRASSDERIILKEKKIYINPSQYDYSDLIR